MTTRQQFYVAGMVLVLAIASPARSQESAADEHSGSTRVVEPVVGSSLLGRLRVGFDGSAFGRVGSIGSLPAAARQGLGAGQPNEATGDWLQGGFQLSGSDLYRINCRSCHGRGGEGLPPVIPAITDPVRASSPELVAQRMAARGRTIPTAVAERLAARAELGIRHRLLAGGQVMPPFVHLAADEVDALLGYLEVVVGASKTEAAELRVDLQAARVGEHVIKANCQVCHDSTDAISRRRPPADRDLPSLAAMTQRYAVWEFVRKVREGSPAADGRRGRMPRFNYLSPAELAASYVYLTAFPPVATTMED